MNLRSSESAPPEQAARGDGELLVEMACDSSEAFDALYQRHVSAVFAYSMSMCTHQAAAEDLTQDAFVLLYEKRRKVRVVGDSVLPWLLVTAKNLSRNLKRKLRREVFGRDLTGTVFGIEAGPEAQAEGHELGRTLRQVIGALNPVDQRVVELCLVSDLSYQQAAAELGLTHSAVRNRLSRSRLRLRASLQQDQLQEEA